MVAGTYTLVGHRKKMFSLFEKVYARELLLFREFFPSQNFNITRTQPYTTFLLALMQCLREPKRSFDATIAVLIMLIYFSGCSVFLDTLGRSKLCWINFRDFCKCFSNSHNIFTRNVIIRSIDSNSPIILYRNT